MNASPRPLILSFFAVLLGYSYFFDKDDEIKLRNVKISFEIFFSSIEFCHRLYAKRLPNCRNILRIAKPEDYLITK